MALRQGSVGMLPPYCQLFIQAIMIRLPFGHVVERDAGVEVAAVVEPVGPLGGGQGGRVGEGELVGQDVAPAAGVVVDDLDAWPVLPRRSRRSQVAQSRCSLLAPVAVRTTLPSTSRLTAVSHWRPGRRPRAENTMWSTLMWPQPPVLSGRRSGSAPAGPARLAASQATQFRSLVVLAGGGGDDLAVDEQVDRGRLPSGSALHGWLPPPTSRSM